MDNMDSMIERYKKELLKFAQNNGDLAQSEPVQQSQESIPVQARVQVPEEREPERAEVMPVEEIREEIEEFHLHKTYTREETIAGENPHISSDLSDGEETSRIHNVTIAEDVTVEQSSSEIKMRHIENIDDEIKGISKELRGAQSRKNKYESIEDFHNHNSRKGMLKVQVFAGDQLFPIQNARVLVTKKIGDREYGLYDKLTNESAVVEDMELPAPPQYSTENENSNGEIPHSTYNVYVEHPNFARAVFFDVPIFEGLLSVQPVGLVPKISTANKPDTTVCMGTGYGSQKYKDQK